MTANPVVALKTSEGVIKIELFPKQAPLTVRNFLAYVNEGFYDGTLFHRVIPNFMIQGGGFESGLTQKETKDPIVNEAGNGLSNTRGTVAMARTNVVDSATAQFFINVADNVFLDHTDDTPHGFGYCVFGKVIEGLDVADKIVNAPRGNFGYHQDVPKEDIVIISAAVEQPEP